MSGLAEKANSCLLRWGEGDSTLFLLSFAAFSVVVAFGGVAVAFVVFSVAVDFSFSAFSVAVTFFTAFFCEVVSFAAFVDVALRPSFLMKFCICRVRTSWQRVD